MVVGVEVLALGVFGTKAWASIYFTPPLPTLCRYRCRPASSPSTSAIPGRMGSSVRFIPEMINEATENFFGLDTTHDQDSKDDIVTAEMAVPVNREIHLLMHSKDVGHSFFVRELRIQQDFVPGLDFSRALHPNQDRAIRNCVHATLRTGSLQHEGLSRSHVAGGFRSSG